MTCGACTSSVESGFKNVDGAGSVSVSLVMGRAVVQHHSKKLSPEAVKEIIEDRGFDAEVLSTDIPIPREECLEEVMSAVSDSEELETQSLSATTLAVEGMTCGACTSAVEAGFKNVPGVKTMSI